MFWPQVTKRKSRLFSTKVNFGGTGDANYFGTGGEDEASDLSDSDDDTSLDLRSPISNSNKDSFLSRYLGNFFQVR